MTATGATMAFLQTALRWQSLLFFVLFSNGAIGGDWTSNQISKLPEGEVPVPLFNGRDLGGWKGDHRFWSVREGVIRGANEGQVPSSTYLFTGRSYWNFRLFFEVKQTLSPGHSTMHSAVAALGKVIDDAGDNRFGFRGPLLMFCHDWGIWDAYRRNRIVPPEHRGTLSIAEEKEAEWNQIEILVTGNRIRFVANGKLVFDYTERGKGMLQASPIGLQLHSNDRPQEFLFRGLVLTGNPKDVLVSLDKGGG